MADKPPTKPGAERFAMDGGLKKPPSPNYQPPKPQSFKGTAPTAPQAAAAPAPRK